MLKDLLNKAMAVNESSSNFPYFTNKNLVVSFDPTVNSKYILLCIWNSNVNKEIMISCELPLSVNNFLKDAKIKDWKVLCNFLSFLKSQYKFDLSDLKGSESQELKDFYASL